MAVAEQARHALYRRLEQTLGAEDATTLMSYLPPTGWADVVVKRDLDALEERLGLRFAAVDLRFAGFDERLDLRFSAVDERFGALELRIDLTEQRLLAAFRGGAQRRGDVPDPHDAVHDGRDGRQPRRHGVGAGPLRLTARDGACPGGVTACPSSTQSPRR